MINRYELSMHITLEVVMILCTQNIWTLLLRFQIRLLLLLLSIKHHNLNALRIMNLLWHLRYDLIPRHMLSCGQLGDRVLFAFFCNIPGDDAYVLLSVEMAVVCVVDVGLLVALAQEYDVLVVEGDVYDVAWVFWKIGV